jgi:hypothetical protein
MLRNEMSKRAAADAAATPAVATCDVDEFDTAVRFDEFDTAVYPFPLRHPPSCGYKGNNHVDCTYL